MRTSLIVLLLATGAWLPASHSAAQPTQEEVFRSIGQNVSEPVDSRRVLALQQGDFTTFASMYNGPGQAARYGSLMQGLFDNFKRLKPA